MRKEIADFNIRKRNIARAFKNEYAKENNIETTKEIRFSWLTRKTSKHSKGKCICYENGKAIEDRYCLFMYFYRLFSIKGHKFFKNNRHKGI